MWEIVQYRDEYNEVWISHNLDFDLWAREKDRLNSLKNICEQINLQIEYARVHDQWDNLDY